MQLSMRSLLLIVSVFGMLPFLYQNWLIPFFVIIAICLGMSFRAFATEFQDDDGGHGH